MCWLQDSMLIWLKGWPEQDPGGEEDPGDNGDDEDTGDDEDPPIFQIQTSTASKDCTANEIQTITENLTIENLVVVTPKFSATQVNDGYYVVDAASVENPVWSGVMILLPKTLATDFALVTSSLTGAKHIEYYCFTEVQGQGLQRLGLPSFHNPLILAPPSSMPGLRRHQSWSNTRATSSGCPMSK